MSSEGQGKKFVVLPPEEYQMLLENNKSTNAAAAATATPTAVGNNNVLQSIEKSAMLKSNDEMKTIWDRKDVVDEEKVLLFMEQFNDFKKYYDKLTKPKVLEVRGTNEVSSFSSPFTPSHKHEGEGRQDSTTTATSDNVINSSDDGTDIGGRGNAAARNVDDDDDDMMNVVLKSLSKTLKPYGQKLVQHVKKYGGDDVKWNESGELIYKGLTVSGSNISDLVKDVITAGEKKNNKVNTLQHL